MAIEIKLHGAEGKRRHRRGQRGQGVGPGDTVAKDQPLLEVQADKAALDVPSPMAGRITKVLVKPGDQIKIGQVYCVIDSGGNGEPAARPRRRQNRRQLPPRCAEEEPATPAPTATGRGTAAAQTAAAGHRAPSPAPPPARNRSSPAGPATRRLARELGVDLRQVHGSGRHGRVVEEDIKAYVRQLASGRPAAAGAVRLRRPGAAAAQLRGMGADRTRSRSSPSARRPPGR